MSKIRLLNTSGACKLPAMVLCASALVFAPNLGVLPAQAVTGVAALQPAGVIKGTVLDPTGEPVIGATVYLVSASGATSAQNAAITDFEGNFSIKAKAGDKLKIVYIGYADQIVTAKDNMKVTLKEDATMLQGVEVVAYGTQKKVTVTGAISSIKSEDLVRTPVSSVNNVLAGQLSGVTSVQFSGEPGSDAADIFVRGKATFAGSDAVKPLIQVDGVEREMWDIDPNEIESVTVLKDASATAVFGVRGANGVILITTKRGKEGKARISANVSFSALTPTKMIDMADSYEYANFYNNMLSYDGDAPMFSTDIVEAFRTNSDPIRLPSMRWTDYIMKDVTLQQQHNVNISGGNNKVKYFLSAGMFTQGGLFESFGRDYDFDYSYQRFNYRGNIDIDVTPTTKLSVNLAGKVDDSTKPRTGQGASGMIKAIYEASPFSSAGFDEQGRYIYTNTNPAYNTFTIPEYDDEGNVVRDADGNPVIASTKTSVLPFTGSAPMTYIIYQPGAYHYNNNRLMMDVILDQKLDFITKGLSLKLKGSYNSIYGVTKELTASTASYTPVIRWNPETATNDMLYLKSGQDTDPSYKPRTSKGRDWYAEGSLSYSRAFGEHTVNALALYNQSKTYYPKTYSDIPRTYVGFVGRVTYDYKNRYMAEFNIGYNGSENFAPGKRFGSFPAGSVGWLISDEPFFKPLSKVISFMKLRASWGLVGNDKVGGSRFMYLADPYVVNGAALMERMGKDANPYAYYFGVSNITGSTQYGATELAKNNADVTWEKAFKQDYGVDVYFLNDKLRISYDYFKEHRTDILWRDGTVPSFLGFSVPYTNFGVVDSWGHEVSVNWQDKIGNDFRYWAKFNLSYNQNEIIEDRQAPQNEQYMYTAGRRIGSRSLYKFWNYYYEGCEADYEKTFGQPFPEQIVQNDQLKPGDALYVDLNNDGKIDTNDMSRDLGYTDDPEYMAGLSFGFSYKGWSFNTQFTGAWNVSRVIDGTFRRPFYNSSGDNKGGLLVYHLENSWSPENPNAEYPRPTFRRKTQNYDPQSTLWEKDAKYLRCKTMQVAYDFSMPWMKKFGMNQLQLALSAYNLFTLTPYKWGDPEVRASNSPSYPLQRTYTLSVKVGF